MSVTAASGSDLDTFSNLIELLYETYWTTLGVDSGGKIAKICGLVGYITEHRDPLLNGVIGPAAQVSDSSVRAVTDYFVQRALPMSWRVVSREPSDQTKLCLTRHGLLLAERAVCMSVAVSEMRPVMRSSRLEIRPVSNESDLLHWVHVLSQGFGFSRVMTECILRAESRRLRERSRSWTCYLGLSNDLPVSTISLRVEKDVGALFNAGTLPGKSSLGCGPSHLMRAVDDAEALGVRRIVLHACPNVERFCARLGFRRHGVIETYVANPEWLREFASIKRSLRLA